MMRNLNPCPEKFDQNVVVWGKLPMGGGGNYQIGSLGETTKGGGKLPIW